MYFEFQYAWLWDSSVFFYFACEFWRFFRLLYFCTPSFSVIVLLYFRNRVFIPREFIFRDFILQETCTKVFSVFILLVSVFLYFEVLYLLWHFVHWLSVYLYFGFQYFCTSNFFTLRVFVLRDYVLLFSMRLYFEFQDFCTRLGIFFTSASNIFYFIFLIFQRKQDRKRYKLIIVFIFSHKYPVLQTFRCHVSISSDMEALSQFTFVVQE